MTLPKIERAAVSRARESLAVTVTELECSSIAEFRTLRGPVAEVHRLAGELGDEQAARRASLLLSRADHNLYAAKHAGRDRVAADIG